MKQASFSYTSVMEVTIRSPSVTNTIFPMQPDVDFCDMMWLFVKNAQSLDDLQRLMTNITEAVFTHVIQPCILMFHANVHTVSINHVTNL